MKKLFVAGIVGVFLLGLRMAPAPDLSTHWVNPRLFDGTVLQATYTPTALKSLQRGTISLAPASATNTATITSVTTTASVVSYLGSTTSNIATFVPDDAMARVELTNATTVTATRITTTNTTVVGFEVYEYLPSFIKSLQRGVITIGPGAATATATISSVTTTKTSLMYGGSTIDVKLASGGLGNAMVKQILTNATTVTADRADTNNTATTAYQALEWR